MSVVDAAASEVAATIGVGHIPTGLAVAGDQLWVSNNVSASVTVIGTRSHEILGTTRFGLTASPSGIALP